MGSFFSGLFGGGGFGFGSQRVNPLYNPVSYTGAGGNINSYNAASGFGYGGASYAYGGSGVLGTLGQVLTGAQLGGAIIGTVSQDVGLARGAGNIASGTYNTTAGYNYGTAGYAHDAQYYNQQSGARLNGGQSGNGQGMLDHEEMKREEKIRKIETEIRDAQEHGNLGKVDKLQNERLDKIHQLQDYDHVHYNDAHMGTIANDLHLNPPTTNVNAQSAPGAAAPAVNPQAAAATTAFYQSMVLANNDPQNRDRHLIEAYSQAKQLSTSGHLVFADMPVGGVPFGARSGAPDFSTIANNDDAIKKAMKYCEKQLVATGAIQTAFPDADIDQAVNKLLSTAATLGTSTAPVTTGTGPAAGTGAAPDATTTQVNPPVQQTAPQKLVFVAAAGGPIAGEPAVHGSIPTIAQNQLDPLHQALAQGTGPAAKALQERLAAHPDEAGKNFGKLTLAALAEATNLSVVELKKIDFTHDTPELQAVLGKLSVAPAPVAQHGTQTAVKPEVQAPVHQSGPHAKPSAYGPPLNATDQSLVNPAPKDTTVASVKPSTSANYLFNNYTYDTAGLNPEQQASVDLSDTVKQQAIAAVSTKTPVKTGNVIMDSSLPASQSFGTGQPSGQTRAV